MSRSSRKKERYGRSGEASLDNCNEGSAARTRPFSFDEIMHRREKKKQSGNVKGDHCMEMDRGLGQSDPAPSGVKHSDPAPSGVKHASEHFVKVSSRKKENDMPIKEDKLVKRKDKEICDSETKSKATLRKYIGDEAKGGKIDRRVNVRRQNDAWSSDDSKNESEKRHLKDLVVKERYADRSRVKSERESKRKHRDEDDEKSRDRNAAKKRESGKRNGSEFSESKERKESSKFRHEESRPNRRRSRSREHDKDRGRRSTSLSPRAQKRASYNVREHGELYSHSSKDRTGRQHSDADRNKVSGNGSSSQNRRHGGFASGLGGYSPRKRRTEAAIKTPSPTNRSPEKKSAGWDLPPAGTDSNVTGPTLSKLQSSDQIVSSNMHELSSVVPALLTTVKPSFGAFPSTSLLKRNPTIDSIQLTQATRPMRRLYVENLPTSASEKSVTEWLNSFLMSSGVNYIQGTQPCISCIIHKEKGQALVEFLTPEDASAALSFDGRSFFGSILKIRRPKDFVEVTTGVPEKSVAAVDSVSDVVKDSPHKIFIGGISKVISSKTLMEIIGAFGPLKAYRFEVNADLNEPCAFLEYVDQSVTLKACAGLNGMKLGGQLLTVVQAIPGAASVENYESQPFYGIPEHAKPLLEKPTQVLKLRNVLSPEGFSSLSEPELEEILEDIRVECARFGTVKSVNVVKRSNCGSTQETCKVTDNTDSAIEDLECDDTHTEIVEGMDCVSGKISRSEPSICAKSEEVDRAEEDNVICDGKYVDNLIKEEICEPAPVDSHVVAENPICQENSNAISPEVPNLFKSSVDQLECHDDKVEIIQAADLEMNRAVVKEELKSEEVNGKLEAAFSELDCGERIEVESMEHVSDLGDVLEPGCVLVEYRRTEATCMAAHCLHGRLFDDRIVSVEYVAYDIYRARFPK
ncbi:splicing factor U2af large subunit B [Cornus florida]|uniref:splicing factor U2af large subunit B n=1 Tax=Cornus florida TaxID=4283 RepID=UPI00289F8770|nr:splicing factor U2af large subunit B [Cornus florida]